jgi:GNAT superfamily N-acetyltransferase
MPDHPAGIRPLARAHREAAAALFAAAHPERADEPAAWGAPSGPAGPRRYVAVAGTAGQIVGYGGWWPVRPGKFRIDLVVAPGHRRCGIGSRLLGQLTEDAHTAGAATVQARADSGRAQSLAFLQHRGFSETMRMHHLVLDVANADLRPFAGIERRLAAGGIVLTTLAEERDRTGEACWARLSDLHNVAREGWPDPDPSPGPGLGSGPGPEELRTPEEVRRLYQLHQQGWPQLCFLAVRGEEYVGFVGPLGTAVRPALRGRGTATALKVREVAAAQERGLPTLDGATGNMAMLKVNERLGYRRTSTEVRLVRPL